MTESNFRNMVSKFIIVSYSILFISIITCIILPGFDDEELMILMGFLTPITAVYMGALIKYAVVNKYTVDENVNLEEKKVNKLYRAVTNWVIKLHFVLLFVLVLLAAFNQITFDLLKILFPIVETAFGAYLGIIMDSLFKVESDQK